MQVKGYVNLSVVVAKSLHYQSKERLPDLFEVIRHVLALLVLALALASLQACGGNGSSSALPTVNPAGPEVTYPQTTINATVGQAIQPDVPSVTGQVTSWSISPALPAGLSFNTSNGAISGTPTAITQWDFYVVAASNSSGSTTATLDIGVNPAAPTSLAYPQGEIVAMVGQAIQPDVPTVSGSVDSYTVIPNLPQGITIDSKTGTISGTPTAITPRGYFTVAATNAAGSAVEQVFITVISTSGFASLLWDLGSDQAWAIAGAPGTAAVSTSSGEILIIDTATGTLKLTLTQFSSQLALSADGSILGASGDYQDYSKDPTLNFYSLPSGQIVSSFPYDSVPPNTQPSAPIPLDFTLSASGTTVGQMTFVAQPSWVRARFATPLSGSPEIWSDTDGAFGYLDSLNRVLLSPDGSLIGVADNILGDWHTSIIQNGTLAATVPGYALAWLDNQRILVSEYTNTSSPPGEPPGNTTVTYVGSSIYSATGSLLASPPLPEMDLFPDMQPIGSDEIYDPKQNTVYSLTTGQPVWTGSSALSGRGAVAGSSVVYASGSSIMIQPL
jgi:hypothetical protein